MSLLAFWPGYFDVIFHIPQRDDEDDAPHMAKRAGGGGEGVGCTAGQSRSFIIAVKGRERERGR